MSAHSLLSYQKEDEQNGRKWAKTSEPPKIPDFLVLIVKGVEESPTRLTSQLLVLSSVSTMKPSLPCCGLCTVLWTARQHTFFMRSSLWMTTVTLVSVAVSGYSSSGCLVTGAGTAELQPAHWLENGFAEVLYLYSLFTVLPDLPLGNLPLACF